MKNLSLHKIVLATCSLLFSMFAWSVPTSGPYVSDPQNAYVQDATSDSIGSVNMILCIIGSMNINGSGMLNNGPYIALIDINKCDSKHSSGSGSSGAAAATNYMTAIINATRGANSTDPMLANIWMSLTEQGKINNISLRLSASQSPTDVPPYGVFRLDYIGKDGAGATQFNGFINSTSGNLQFYETGSNSSNTALSLTPGTSDSGSGTITTTPQGSSSQVTFNFNYNIDNFRRADGTNDECFDRKYLHAAKSVWRYGTYNNTDGTRVDQANPSFQITATTSSPLASGSYYGFAGYYGMGFQGLDLNSITDASPISGLTVTDQRPGNTTTYNLSKVGGKLTKWTQNATTLSAMSGIPFSFYGDLTGKTTGDTSVTGWSNWQLQWNNGTSLFAVLGKQVCDSNGCNLSPVSSATTVNSTAFNGLPIYGWSDSFGGSMTIPATVSAHVSGDTVSYFSQSTVIPGSGSAPANLYCLSNCPDATSVGAANAYTTPGTAPSPFNATTTTQWNSAPNSGGVTVSYTFDAGGLKIGSTAMIINNAAFYKDSPNFQWGVQSGRLFDAAFATCLSGTAVCEPSNASAYYTWSTGIDQWNQSMWLTKTSDNSIVPFDPPQNIPYTIPNDATTYGTWANKTIQMQFNGFGNLYGIPGNCVSPVDNTTVPCGPNTRYVPAFSIPDGANMTLNSTTLAVKALDMELRLNRLGPGGSTPQCSGLNLTTLTPPSGGTHDMTNPSDAYYIGTTNFTGTPKVIDGIVQ